MFFSFFCSPSNSSKEKGQEELGEGRGVGFIQLPAPPMLAHAQRDMCRSQRFLCMSAVR